MYKPMQRNVTFSLFGASDPKRPFDRTAVKSVKSVKAGKARRKVK